MHITILASGFKYLLMFRTAEQVYKGTLRDACVHSENTRG